MPVPFADLQLQYQTIKSEIDGAIANVIRDNAFIRGPYVDAFEREFAEAVEAKHCVSCAAPGGAPLPICWNNTLRRKGYSAPTRRPTRPLPTLWN